MLEELSVPPQRDPTLSILRLDAEGLRTCACGGAARLKGAPCFLTRPKKNELHVSWETDGYDVVFHGYMMLRKPWRSDTLW